MPVAVLHTFSAAAQAPVTLDPSLLQPLTFRNLEPFWLGARVSNIAVPAAPEAAHLYLLCFGTTGDYAVTIDVGGVRQNVNARIGNAGLVTCDVAIGSYSTARSRVECIRRPVRVGRSVNLRSALDWLYRALPLRWELI